MVDRATITAIANEDAMRRLIAKLLVCAASLIVVLRLVYADCAPRL
jgi:hypothetical protein